MSRLLVLGRDGMLGAALAHGLAKTHTVTALARAAGFQDISPARTLRPYVTSALVARR
mgnify:CR=1 FL=1